MLPTDSTVCWEHLHTDKQEKVPTSVLLESNKNKILGNILVIFLPSACNLGNSGRSEEVNSLQTCHD